jgi:hypothetical protein
VLAFEGVGAVDATAIEMLTEPVKTLQGRGIVVAVARANDRALTSLQRAGLVSEGALRVFETINRAVREFEASRPAKAPAPGRDLAGSGVRSRGARRGARRGRQARCSCSR